MVDDKTPKHIGVRILIGSSYLIALMVLTQAGCRRHGPYRGDIYTEAETKGLIEKLTGCTMPSQAYDMKAFAFDAKGRHTYATFRVPPEASSDVLAAFQHEGVKADLDQGSFMAFYHAELRQDEIGMRLFDPNILGADPQRRPQITGPVRCLQFGQKYPPGYWVMIVFEEKGIVWFVSAVNLQD